MKKSLIFFFLLFFVFFSPSQAEAQTGGRCLCRPRYRSQTRRMGTGDCPDVFIRVCEIACSEGENCTSWRRYRNRWQRCRTDEDGTRSCWCETGEPLCSISYEREYNCTDNCGGRLQERINETGCGTGRTGWVNIREGFEWQKCDPALPGFYCDSDCVEAPQNLREYQDPNSSIPADSPVKLPVKLDWDDVPGFWSGGWAGGGSAIQKFAECQRGFIDFCWAEARRLFEEHKETRPTARWCQGEWTDEYLTCLRRESAANCEDELKEEVCEEECPPEEECYKPDEFVQSYKITITGDLRSCDDGSDMSGYTDVLGVSEFFAPCPCFFKSNESYTWTVQACCDEGGRECGPPSSSSFTTILAPEPIYPEDPDWAGPGRAEPSWDDPTYEGHPVELEWCKVDEANSYFVQAYREGLPYCPTILCPFCENCPMLLHKEGGAVPQTFDPPKFYFDLDSFTKETLYDWEIATCLDEEGADCGDFGQRWKFFGVAGLAKVQLKSPENRDCVNFHSQLEWLHVSGARSYRYTIREVPVLQNILATTTVIYFRDIWNNLGFNTTYTWQVKACWDEQGNECEDLSLSDIWEFTTTGAVPTGLDIIERDPVTGNALIPIKLNWDDMPCAASYKYELIENSGGATVADGVIGSSEVSINYDSVTQHPKQNTSYSYKIWTCANSTGDKCGSEASLSFTTFELKEPENPYPLDNEEFYTYEYTLGWSPVLGGAFYEYEIVGKISPTIIGKNNVFIDTSVLELGTYTWSVRACIDANCQQAGPPITWTFELVEGEAPEGGIVPCGRYTDNPNTPWNEREHCGIQHVFIMIFSIIDFLLWKAIPIVLALLALTSGIMFYFSRQLGITAPLSQVKSLWRAAGIGLAVIFLAWTGVSLILGLLGYQVGVFGDWWRIEF